MRVCYISMEYPPETGWGGIGTYTYNMSHAMAELGNDVHVVTLATKSEHDYCDGKVVVHRLQKKYLPVPLIQDPLSCFVRSLKVCRCLSRFYSSFDVIEAPEWRAEGIVSCLFSKTPIVTRLHTPFFWVNHLSSKQVTPADRIVDFLEKTQTILSNGITSPTRALRKVVSDTWNIDASRIIIIPNGLNIERIRSIKKEPSMIESDYIVYIGRLEARKGVQVLARALPRVFENFQNLKVAFIGLDMKYRTGTMREYIEEINHKNKDNLVFFGYVPEEMKFSIIADSKLVILPSLWENFPYTCLESMALGKAVIATTNSGFSEIIVDRQSGFLVKPGDPEALSNQIIRCLGNDYMIKIVEKYAERRAEDFDIKKIAKCSVNYYEAILDSQR